MIIWSGKGGLSLVILGAVFFVCSKIMPAELIDLQLMVCFLVTGGFSWFFGNKWNKKQRRLIDKSTGREVTTRSSHSIFGIPMQFWGLVFIAIGLFFGFLYYMTWFLSKLTINFWT